MQHPKHALIKLKKNLHLPRAGPLLVALIASLRVAREQRMGVRARPLKVAVIGHNAWLFFRRE